MHVTQASDKETQKTSRAVVKVLEVASTFLRPYKYDGGMKLNLKNITNQTYCKTLVRDAQLKQ